MHVHFGADREQKAIDAHSELVRSQRVRVAEAEQELRRLRDSRDQIEASIRTAERELLVRTGYLDAARDQLLIMMAEKSGEQRR